MRRLTMLRTGAWRRELHHSLQLCARQQAGVARRGFVELGHGPMDPTDEVTFWSVNGQKLATYQLTTTLGVGPPEPSAPAFYATQTACNYYFGGRLIKNGNGNGWVYSDRLGSIGKFYPYGMEASATTNGTEKFTGYFQDSESGNDYAVNRYMSPGMGRFITPDRGMGGAKSTDPGSWNKYAYARAIRSTGLTTRACYGRVPARTIVSRTRLWTACSMTTTTGRAPAA